LKERQSSTSQIRVETVREELRIDLTNYTDFRRAWKQGYKQGTLESISKWISEVDETYYDMTELTDIMNSRTLKRRNRVVWIQKNSYALHSWDVENHATNSSDVSQESCYARLVQVLIQDGKLDAVGLDLLIRAQD
jgi:hypothetical protein